MGRTYRTRLEVLHDFLEASRRTTRKTRIIGLANLNPGYFDIYAQFCLDHGLLELTTDGYRSTELAEQVLVAIRRILSKTAELDGAIRSLSVVIRQEEGSASLAIAGSRAYAPADWQEILLHSVPRLSLPNSGVTVRAPRGLAIGRSAVLPRSSPELPPGDAARSTLVAPASGRHRHSPARLRDRSEIAP